MPTLGRTAAITGASSGIGAAFARQLAAQGYNLVLVARRTAAMEEMAADLRKQHAISVECITADLTRDDDVAAVGQKLAAVPDLELLVNNAGFGTRGLFFQTDARRQDDMHRLHVLATERLTRAVLPELVSRKRGGIINVASIAGFLQSPGSVSYFATKAWMISFSEGLHLEMQIARSPVTIQALCPGFTYSEFHQTMGGSQTGLGKSWWMTSDFVVSESLRGLRDRKLIVIPGWRYRLLIRVIGILPRSLVLKAMARGRTT